MATLGAALQALHSRAALTAQAADELDMGGKRWLSMLDDRIGALGDLEELCVLFCWLAHIFAAGRRARRSSLHWKFIHSALTSMLRTPSHCPGAPAPILNGALCLLAFSLLAMRPAGAAGATDAAVYCGLPTLDGPAMPAAGAADTLADLVAIGMRQNTETRVAWSQAEEAALNLGIARSKYGPILAAQAAALVDHAAFPLPKTLNPNGYFKSDAEALVPALTLKWLLYDGGGREAVLDRAGQQLAGANFGFSAAHRRVTLQITQQFFRLSAQVARLAAAQDTLHSAQAVEQLAQARQHRGLGTAPETLQARAQVAEAQLQMEAADAAAQDVHMALL